MEEKIYFKVIGENDKVMDTVYTGILDAEAEEIYTDDGKKFCIEDVIETDSEGNELYYCLTPKACFFVSLCDSLIISGFPDDGDKKMEEIFNVLESQFEANGFIKNSSQSEIKPGKSQPSDIFKRTLRVYFPKASDDKVDMAWDIFVNMMIKHENTTITSNEKDK